MGPPLGDEKTGSAMNQQDGHPIGEIQLAHGAPDHAGVGKEVDLPGFLAPASGRPVEGEGVGGGDLYPGVQLQEPGRGRQRLSLEEDGRQDDEEDQVEEVAGVGVPLRQRIGRQDDGDRAAQARPADEQALAQGEVASYRADEDTIAKATNISPLPLVMGIAMSCSCCFLTPITTPPNTIVMGPGKYRFLEYAKYGWPLQLISLILCWLLIPLIWPFHT